MKKRIADLAVVLAVCGIIAGIYFINRNSSTKTKENNHLEKESANQMKEQQNHPQDEKISIWIMGDSLSMEHASAKMAQGWGTMLKLYLTSDVEVKNTAAGGQSSSSYAQMDIYKIVMEDLKAGDYVFVQFGHNDAWFEDRWTDPYGDSRSPGSFQYVLKHEYIEPILEKGAHVILATSVMDFGNYMYYLNMESDYPQAFYADYVQAMKELAKECEEEKLEILFIDTFQITWELYRQIGIEEARKFHVSDEVHYSRYGATYVAGLICQELKKLGVPIFQEIRSIEEVVNDIEQ